MSSPNPITNKFYILEFIRSLAAIYVLIYHIQQKLNFGPVFSLFFSFGQESVMIFFVLSGFVIYYSVETKKVPVTIINYFKARFFRIYPTFVLACLLAYSCQSIIAGHFIIFPVNSFIENICMLQDFSTGKPGTWVQPFMGNTPLWSLSYEWWFYILFIPVYFFINKSKQYIAVITLSSLGFITYLIMPNQISIWTSYFILWWMGVEASKKYLMDKENEKIMDFKKIIIVIVGYVLILIIYTFFYEKNHIIHFGLFPIILIRHYVMALLFAFFLRVYDVRKINISKSNILVRFAPYTYALYVFHYPVLQLFESKKWLSSYWGIPLLILFIISLCYLAENIIQKNIVKWSAYKVD